MSSNLLLSYYLQNKLPCPLEPPPPLLKGYICATRRSSVGRGLASHQPLSPVMSTPGEPGLTVTELSVNGMCCQSEANLVHKKLGVLPGVTNIRINMLLRQVLVTHEETLDPARLVRTLNWALLDAHVNNGSSGSLLQKGKPSMITVLAVVCGVLFAVSLDTAVLQFAPWLAGCP